MQNGNRETWGNGRNSEARKGRRTWQATTEQVQALGKTLVGQQLQDDRERGSSHLQVSGTVTAPMKCRGFIHFFQQKPMLSSKSCNIYNVGFFFLNKPLPFPPETEREYFQLVLGWGTKQARGTKQPSLLIQPWR